MTSTEPIAAFFDHECCAAVDAGASIVPGATGVTAVLLRALDEAGIRDLSVLELGSGAGALSRELVARGAARVMGIDLSPISVEHATKAGQAAGVSERLSYRVGDGAEVPLEAYDVVVSQKVFCCYPQPDRLLDNTLPAAGRVYALVLPDSRGPIGAFARLIVAIENAVQRLRRERFRGYVHDVQAIERRLAAAGFERRLAQRHWAWLVLVFARR